MNKTLVGLAALGLGILVAAGTLAQPPGGGPPDGPPPQRRFGPRGDGPPPGPPGHPVMAALDADKNGTLSADEIAAASAALKGLDKNDDGELTEDELRPPRPPHDRGPGDGGFGRGPRDGDRPGGPPEARRGPPEGGEARGPRVLPPGAEEHLGLSEEQRDQIASLEKDVKAKVEEILDSEQRDQLAELFRRGPGRPGGPPDGPRGPRPPRD